MDRSYIAPDQAVNYSKLYVRFNLFDFIWNMFVRGHAYDIRDRLGLTTKDDFCIGNLPIGKYEVIGIDHVCLANGDLAFRVGLLRYKSSNPNLTLYSTRYRDPRIKPRISDLKNLSYPISIGMRFKVAFEKDKLKCIIPLENFSEEDNAFSFKDGNTSCLKKKPDVISKKIFVGPPAPIRNKKINYQKI